MGNSVKRVFRITIFVCGALFVDPLIAADPNTAEIEKLSEAVRAVVETFEREGFESRMRYLCEGAFRKYSDKEKLRRSAEAAIEKLRAIEQDQKELKSQIEHYQDADWDQRFGQTGLWRKLAGDIHKTALNRCEIQFYQALSENGSNRKKILLVILEEVSPLEETFLCADAQLLRVRILGALGQTEANYSKAAINELERLLARPDIPERIYFGAAIEKIKLKAGGRNDLLNSLTGKIEKSPCGSDPEVVLPAAFVMLRHNSLARLGKTILKNPRVKDFLGSLILEELEESFKSGKLTNSRLLRTAVFDVELAAAAAGKDQAKDHKVLLSRLLEIEKFQTALITYVTATALAETRGNESAALLIKSSRLQRAKKSPLLNVEAHLIAKQAAQLAYKNYISNASTPKETLEAFENYFEIAANKTDERLEYLYSVVLRNCGQPEKAKKQLEKIVSKSVGSYANRAKLDLILYQLRQEKTDDPAAKIEIIPRLKDLLAGCGETKADSEIAAEAAVICNRLLIDSKDRNLAQQILDMFARYDNSQPEIEVLRSKALRRLSRLHESAKCMLRAVEENGCRYEDDARGLLRQIVDEIDYLQAKSNFAAALRDYKQLAKFCCECTEDTKSKLLLIEIEIVTADKSSKTPALVSDILKNYAAGTEAENIDLLRCRARLLTETEDFSGAGRLWAQIAEIQKNLQSHPNEPGPKWWRAKFYEIYCRAKLPETEKEDVLHTIDVLKNSYSRSPQFWLEKFNLLEKQLAL